MSYLRRRLKKRTARLNAKAGKRVWTRQLVHYKEHADGSVTKRVFLGMYPKPAFRCIFVSEDGDKHLNVIGPDGKPPWYPGTHKSIAPAAIRHVPGSSMPDKTTDICFYLKYRIFK